MNRGIICPACPGFFFGGCMEPIIEFKSTEQAIGCLYEWKERLGINDWVVKVDLCEKHEFKLSDVVGECDYEGINKCAIIRILKPEYYGDRIIKYCAEEVLVHELLHCKLSLLNTEENCFNNLLHQTQEDIARALICAKYGVSNDWFSNISYDDPA
jgi:hypothetical protein